MAEVEITISSAKDLKNVNWRHGPIRPYAVVWIDPNNKSTTKVDEEGDICPYWDQTLILPLPAPIDDETALCIDIVHAGNEEGTKKLIGSAKLKIKEVLEEAGYGERIKRNLKLKRPSGRPHGKIDVTVSVNEQRYRERDAYYAPPYAVPPSRDFPAPPPPYGNSYAAVPPPYGAAPPPNASGNYPAPPPPYVNTYAAAPPPYGASPPQYGTAYGGDAANPAGYSYAAPQVYGQGGYGGGSGAPAAGYYGKEEKKSKFGGMGTGLAVGAVAGALGGLALAEGFDALEDHVADEAAEKVEEDLGYDDDGDF